jgi:hypothetical protein
MSPVATQNAPAPVAAEAKQTVAGLPKEAINRVARGNKEGTLQLETFPDYWTKTDEESLLKKRQYIKVSTSGKRRATSGGQRAGAGACVLRGVNTISYMRFLLRIMVGRSLGPPPLFPRHM